MLDESFCCGLSDADTPRIGVAALLAVATLLDYHRSSVGSSANAYDPNLKTERHKATHSKSSSAPSGTASAGERSAGVSGTVRGDDEGRDQLRTKGGLS
jgi:hypothetical protein